MTRYAIAYDTICTGYTAILDENGKPDLFDSREAAQAEIDNDPEFYDGCFAIEEREIGHKTIFHSSRGERK